MYQKVIILRAYTKLILEFIEFPKRPLFTFVSVLFCSQFKNFGYKMITV